MAKAADQGYLNATILAEYLVKKGIPFRKAHEVVGKMVAYCIEKQCRLEELSMDEMKQFSLVITEEIYDHISVENAAKACMPSTRLNDEISFCENQLNMKQAWLEEKENQICL